jgi:hypothetical protein
MLNKVAHAPKQAVDKAQAAIDARRASGQSRIDAAVEGEEPPQKTANAPTKPAVTTSSASTQVAQGVTATVPIQATPEASAAFRAFVQNAKIQGVVFGVTPARAQINGQLARAGITVVDNALGITFDSVDIEKKLLIFKDRTGATVSKRFQ